MERTDVPDRTDVTDNSRNSGVVGREALGILEIRRVQVLRAMRQEIKPCDNKARVSPASEISLGLPQQARVH